jgi:hypothetical protein
MFPAICSKVIFAVATIAAIFLLALSANVFADDSAASIAAGGLVPRRETRIVMAKEVLRISGKKVIVDYDFRNDTDENVTTEVAFPVPPYTDDIDEPDVRLESFSDFRLEIDGKAAKFAADAKAIFKGKDVTDILTRDKIDIVSFGHFEQGPSGNGPIHDLIRLPKSEQKRLIALGLFSPESDEPQGNWTVHLQYHWTQTFPARSITHIRHEYSPVVGFTQIPSPSEPASLAMRPAKAQEAAKIDQNVQDELKVLNGFCPESSFLHSMMRGTNGEGELSGTAFPQWVDFILTTANTWKRPIEDFTLIVERPKSDPVQFPQYLISFCSPGPVEKLDADHFQVHLTNFVPKAELHIGFFGLPAAKAPISRQKK